MNAGHRHEAERIRQEIFRRMTPAQKVAAANQLDWSARALKAAGLRAAHPQWSQARVEEGVRQAFMRART